MSNKAQPPFGDPASKIQTVAMETVVAMTLLVLAAAAGLSIAPECQPELAARLGVVRALRGREYRQVAVRRCAVLKRDLDLECTATATGLGLEASRPANVTSTALLLGPDACRQLHATLQYTTEFGDVMQMEENGMAQSKGPVPACERVGHKVRQRNTVVELDMHVVPVLRESGVVDVPWGGECAYADGHCSDAHADAFWSVVPETDCEDQRYDLLYEGPARLAEANDTKFVASANASDPWAFRVAGEARVCGERAFVTDQARVVVVVSENGQFAHRLASDTPAALEADDSVEKKQAVSIAATIPHARCASLVPRIG